MLKRKMNMDYLLNGKKVRDNYDNEVRDIIAEDGYCIIRKAVNYNKIRNWRESFNNYVSRNELWLKWHNSYNTHGIEKAFANYLRFPYEMMIDEEIIEYWKNLWRTEELIYSLSSLIYIPKRDKAYKWEHWVHCDQAATLPYFCGYQSQVNLTTNDDNCLFVYGKSHKLIGNFNKGDNNNFNRVPIDYLNKSIEEGLVFPQKVRMDEGDMVIWDSRTWHHGVHINPYEERLTKNLSFFPKAYTDSKNSVKRWNYTLERRQTNHWPSPILVNPKLPRNYGRETIDSNLLEKEFIGDLLNKLKNFC